MSWVTAIWFMTAGACLTLGVVHFLVWCGQRAAWGNVFFAISAVATGGMAGCELWMMHAESPIEWGVAARWIHVPAYVLILSLVGFVRVYLRAGRVWLAWTVVGVRTVSLLLNFLFTPNLNFREITGLRPISFLGESVATVVGVPNPWMLIAQLSLVLLLAFVVDATVAVWRRGEHRAAVQIGFNMVFFVFLASGQAILSLWGFTQAPIIPSVFYLGIVLAMAYELSRDLLRSVRMAEELRENIALQKQMQDRFRLSVEASPNGVVLANAEGCILLVNGRAAQMFGYPREEIVGLGIESLVPERFRGAHASLRSGFHAAPTARAMGAGRELFARRKDGSEFPVEIGINPVDSAEGTLVLSIIVDISSRRQSEAEAQELRDELAHLTRVTTLSELSGSLAHELNQPLAIILSNAQAAQRLLAQTPPDCAEVRDILADIVAEDRRAGEVIQRLRTLLKRGEITRAPLALNETIEEVLLLARPNLAGREITVTRALDAGLPQVSGDRVQLQQVVLNLILNSADAMAANAPGTRRLHVVTARRDGVVRVSVRDEGCGLPAEPEQLFAPFFTTKPHGLGMGLAICRSIVGAHGGRLWAEPHPERGAIFHFELAALPTPAA